jgi:hypothetical protein
VVGAGQFAAATGRGPDLLLSEVNGLVPWLLARAAWSAEAGVSALVVDPPGGPGPGAAQPGQLQAGRALDSLSIRA